MRAASASIWVVDWMWEPEDEDQAAKATRDPVAPAERSARAKAKVAQRHHADGTPIHSFQTLLTELATIVRNTCRTSAEEDAPTFTVTTQSNPLQRRAMDLIDAPRRVGRARNTGSFAIH